MVKHIIFFRVKEDADSRMVTETARTALEPLVGQIPGLMRLEVQGCFTGPDFVLYSEFENRTALEQYADHPLHVAAKMQFFHFLAERSAADYEV